MSFESGSISCRISTFPHPIPDDAVEKFAGHAAPPLNTLGSGEIHGWVTGRHLLDRDLREDTASYAGYLRLTLMQAERKIPEPLLRAECKMEEIAELEASGRERLSAKIRSEIRKRVTERLLPDMPPNLKGIHFVYHKDTRFLYTSGMSDKQVDALSHAFQQSLGMMPILVTPDSAAILRNAGNPRDWSASSFSPEVDDDEATVTPGEDFLTWLWFVSEARGGTMVLDQLGTVAIMIDGPLTFFNEAGGAQEAVVRKGEPRLSAEAKTALMSGKKLRRAKLALALDEERTWSTTIDSTFAFRGLKLPEGEKLDAVSKFQERQIYLDQFCGAFLDLYEIFCRERNNPTAWSATVQDLREWVRSRKTRN